VSSEKKKKKKEEKKKKMLKINVCSLFASPEVFL
jgi:hypothetical protein